MFGIFKKKKPVEPKVWERPVRPHWTTESNPKEVVIDFDMLDVFSITRVEDDKAEIGWLDAKGKTHEWFVIVNQQSYDKLINDYKQWKQNRS